MNTAVPATSVEIIGRPLPLVLQKWGVAGVVPETKAECDAINALLDLEQGTPSIWQQRFELFVRTANAVSNDDPLGPQEAEFDRLMRESVTEENEMPETYDKLLALLLIQLDQALKIK